MTGLLLKDLYTLGRQMRIYILLILLFALLPGNTLYAFAIMYAAMPPYTALAYDERSHWIQLARMMPCTTMQLAACKYVLGWLAVAVATVFTAVGTALSPLWGVARQEALDHLVSLPALIGAALLMMAVSLPLMFRFGVERGRSFFWIMLIVFALAVPLLAAQSSGSGGESPVVFWLIAAGLPAAGILAQPVSIALSAKWLAASER